MNKGLPLPHFESEGLEDSYCQYHEGGADETCADGIFVTFVHTISKGNVFPKDNQTICHISAIYHTIRHISMLFIPDIWSVWQHSLPLHHDWSFRRLVVWSFSLTAEVKSTNDKTTKQLKGKNYENKNNYWNSVYYGWCMETGQPMGNH